MKKVRFVTPASTDTVDIMNDSDCHSPRPFIQRHLDGTAPELPNVFAKEIVYSPDSERRFECSDGSPYPLVSKTLVPNSCETGNRWTPCNDLELSMLDSYNQQPRKPAYFTPVSNLPMSRENLNTIQKVPQFNLMSESPINVLSPVENSRMVIPQNTLNSDENFFITRGGLKKIQLLGSVQVQMNKLSLGKENKCNVKVDVPINGTPKHAGFSDDCDLGNESCRCHHCMNVPQNSNFNTSTPGLLCGQNPVSRNSNLQNLQHPLQRSCNRCMCTQARPMTAPQQCDVELVSPKPQNAVDKKAWFIEKYEQTQNKCMDVEKQKNVNKEKREPTVSDLLKIIKLQNEQLQLLQEKVDKLISTNNYGPIHNFMSERAALETIDHDQHKISIGVMTSLEMVRTSTVINQEQIVKRTYENAQIQCNRSEISIKEVVKQPVNLNFLDGITPVGKTANLQMSMNENPNQHISNFNEEKTLNEMSLYNVQVDNATTPLMSPEQSLYLDVRDYSGSDSSSDHSNVGWTYYNKVMTHVNGMLQDSDMPSSASALYRNTRQCMQMQIDKTNISVTKRVTFGDDAPVAHQPQLAGADTSMRMNQLAAKYLKTTPAAALPALRPNEMSFATRNYMERHKLIQGQTSSRRVPTGEVPRFLDITSLKQQPKLL